MQAVFSREDRKGAIADELEYITAMLIDCRDDHIRIVVQQRYYLFRCCIGDARESSQVAEPNDGIDLLGNAAHNSSAQNALPSIAAKIGFHHGSEHARERY